MRGNTFTMTEIAPNKGYENFSNMTTWSIHVSMFAEFEKLTNLYVISISARFHKPSHLLFGNLLNK